MLVAVPLLWVRCAQHIPLQHALPRADCKHSLNGMVAVNEDVDDFLSRLDVKLELVYSARCTTTNAPRSPGDEAHLRSALSQFPNYDWERLLWTKRSKALYLKGMALATLRHLCCSIMVPRPRSVPFARCQSLLAAIHHVMIKPDCAADWASQPRHWSKAAACAACLFASAARHSRRHLLLWRFISLFLACFGHAAIWGGVFGQLALGAQRATDCIKQLG